MMEHELLVYYLRGDLLAVKLCEDLGQVSQVWDDLIDKDKETSPADINDAFWRALIEIPSNPFYLQHIQMFLPLLHSAITGWYDSNTLERGNATERALAFVLRDKLGEVIIMCAHLVGGFAWGRQVAISIRQNIINTESLQNYLQESKS